MTRTTILNAGLVLAGLAAAGCGQPNSPAPKADSARKGEAAKKADAVAKKDGHDDHGPGPHGGTVIEFGKYHGEFTVDHAKKEVTVYILNDNLKKASPIPAGKLLLSIKSPQFQVELKASAMPGEPAGQSSRFTATHDNFGKEQDFEGTLSGEIEGKPYLGDFKHKHDDDHKHDKK